MNSSDNKPNRSLTKFLAASLTLSIVGLSPAAHAASGTWTGASDANWIPALGGTNWSTGVDAFPGATSGVVNTDIATFTGTVTNLSVGINSTSLNVGGITFGAAANPSYSIGINGGNALLLSGGLTGTPATAAGASAITNSTAIPAATFRNMTIAAPVIIQNSGVTGSGSITLLGNSSGNAGNGSTSSSALKITGTVSGNATTGNTSTLYLSGGGDFRASTLANTNEVSGVIQDQAVGSGNTGALSVVYTTPGGGSNTSWVISAANTYTGGTTITRVGTTSNSGIVRVANNSALGTGAITFTNNAQTSASTLAAGVDNITLSNTITSGSVASFASIASNNFNFTLSGAINDNGVNTLGLVKFTSAAGNPGPGTLNLTNTNSSYSLLTQVNAGTLAVTKLSNGGVNSSIGTASGVAGGSTTAAGLLLGNGTTLSYTGSGDSTDRLFTINGTAAAHAATLSANGTGAVNFTNAGNIAYNTIDQARTLNLTGTNTGNNTLAPAIGNNGVGVVGVAKSGVGTWVLSGANTYTGPTTVTGGTLATAGTGTLGLSNVTLTGAVTLTLGSTASFGDSNTLTFGSLSFINMNFTGSDTLLSISNGVTTLAGTGLSYTAAQLNSHFGVTLFASTTGGTFTIAAVPEPGTWGLMIGIFGLLIVLQRRRRQQDA